ncbi:MAG: hypothetical protein CR967_05340 [Proteobacteria bacterium]|nr:MAG: hypothetical protein CR967_05340 [Pseudomonadota bacterium]
MKKNVFLLLACLSMLGCSGNNTQPNSNAKAIEQFKQPTKAYIEKMEKVADMRSNPARLKDFIPQGDGTVLDKRTGLYWMRCTVGTTWNGSGCTGKPELYYWNEIGNVCGEYAGKNNWRVPHITELETLTYCSSGKDKGRDDDGDIHGCVGNFQRPTIPQKIFPDIDINSQDASYADPSYWSASIYEPKESTALVVDFFTGDSVYSEQDNAEYVRCVRNAD